jgi:hypothetical protein
MSQRMTPHQKRVYLSLALASDRAERHWGDPWIGADVIGSRAALDHLVDKGYALRQDRPGPRGGHHYHYRPTKDAAGQVVTS